jgi:hypothetical protein
MLTLDTVKNKVQKMLIELNGSIKIDKDGDFVVSGNSAHVFVSVYELGAGEKQRFQVRFTCPLVLNVPVTYELCLHIATEGTNYRFGCVNMELSDDKKTCGLFYIHSILGNDLDISELDNAIRAVLFTSDALDTELHKQFGGEMYGEDKD